MSKTFLKDPDATIDYVFDWSLYLDAISDTIASATIIADIGITVVSSEVVGATVVVFLSGGTLNDRYKIVCRVTTVGGRIDDRSLFVKIKEA